MDKNSEMKILQNKLMTSADKLTSIRMRCRETQQKVRDITLPKIELSQIIELRKHLTNHNKIKGGELKHKFLNLRNAFLIIREMDEDIQTRKNIEPIIRFLSQFRFVFDMIIESQNKKETRELEIAMQILNFEIDLFCIKYSRILDEENDGLQFTKMKTEKIEGDNEDT